MIDKTQIMYERASFARDLEYLRCMANDNAIMETMYSLDTDGRAVRLSNMDIFESEEDTDEEILEFVDQIPDNDESQEEIERIVKSNKDMTIDDIMGIADNDDPSGEEMDATLDMIDNELEGGLV